MRSPAFAIAWSIWSRHRTGFIVSAATLAVTAALCPLLFAITLAAEWVLAGSTLPLVGVFALVWNGLLFVEESGNLSSHYPRHMLTLPDVNVYASRVAFRSKLHDCGAIVGGDGGRG